MSSTDRRQIAGLLLPYFPTMRDATSEDWAALLNAETGLSIGPHITNGAAFDAWRKALAAKGYAGVWGYTPAEEADMKERGRLLAERAKEWRVSKGIPEPAT